MPLSKIHCVRDGVTHRMFCGVVLPVESTHAISDRDEFKRLSHDKPSDVCRRCLKGLEPRPEKMHSDTYRGRKFRRQVRLNQSANRYARNVRLGRTGVRY